MGTGAKVALWLTLGGVVLLVGCGALVVGLSGATQPSMAEVEREIKPELQRQTNANLRRAGLPATARVRSVQCVQGAENAAKCFARITGTDAGTQRVGIDVTINPNDGSLLWRTES